ncbi:hypothetical protein BTUL_0191g00050 [Botrytis tulipae]|uniref:Uncharacterized protein n=1 Tax=Botrytis tulipae TaxID=87230 RepID=A0A4Z1E9F8_9HELO|nr:hypothetical protein BTUL_0191g00050 [Botrytis tulipae]
MGGLESWSLDAGTWNLGNQLKSTKLWGKLNFEIDDDVYPIRTHFHTTSKDKSKGNFRLSTRKKVDNNNLRVEEDVRNG